MEFLSLATTAFAGRSVCKIAENYDGTSRIVNEYITSNIVYDQAVYEMGEVGNIKYLLFKIVSKGVLDYFVLRGISALCSSVLSTLTEIAFNNYSEEKAGKLLDNVFKVDGELCKKFYSYLVEPLKLYWYFEQIAKHLKKEVVAYFLQLSVLYKHFAPDHFNRNRRLFVNENTFTGKRKIRYSLLEDNTPKKKAKTN